MQLISIIIPTYNRAHLIGGTLDSILAQTCPNWECIVVDDGSTDFTKELMEFYCKMDVRIQYHPRPKNRRKGANACRNYGLQKSNGDFILWFDSDDLMNDQYCEKAIKVLDFESGNDFVFFNYQVFEENIPNIIINQQNNSNLAVEDYLAGNINLATGCVIWRKQILSSGFNEKLDKSQELNFIFNHYKLHNGNLKGGFVDYIAYYLRKHDNSIVSSFKLARPKFLFSDIYVRNEITKYFNCQEHLSIYNHQREELTKSLYNYFKNAEVAEIIKIFFSQLSSNELLTFIFYRLVYKFTGRDHRLKKVLSYLSNKSFKFNLA